MYKSLLEDIAQHLWQNPDPLQALEWVCAEIQQKLFSYDWVGFYFHNLEKEELHLKAFAGKPTDHIVIPFGKGICGQVALVTKTLWLTTCLSKTTILLVA